MVDGNYIFREVGHINIRGKSVNHGEQYDPYYFEPYATFRGDYKESDYSFRTDGMSLHPDKFYNCCMRIWGIPRIGASIPSKVQEFLSLYFGEAVLLTGIEHAINIRGYPYDIYYYRVNK